ncbi:MAG: acyl carrier protein [Bacteroidetes bacterium]|jgi:acyl carrier protein|nr:acyl carrier protein [Bacteroidota bacterium]MBT6686352.1 acyl carrier protein [Bacteroidota bacterium]MBT7142185.1 acyl carrier protein [Bacteroidota bacterium]MBT7490460.1 acyl carrier protein [Bacteroidota bacterium]
MNELFENLKIQLIELLNLEDIESDEIGTVEPLFGDGLGLDSIDALEIIVLLEKEYGLKIENPKDGKEIMYSIETLGKFITKNQERK